jgi:alanyl-tRNA synthetase
VTIKLFQDDPYLVSFDAIVLGRREHDGRPAVVLDRTAFYAESGGQPWDTGTLGGVPVVAVLEQGDEILHVLGAPLAADRVTGTVDADRRRDHREQHHGQHLLSRAFVDTASARTVSFHLGADTSTIDLDRAVSEAQVEAAERTANEVVWSARPVRVRTLTRAAAVGEGLTVPTEAGDAVRVVEAEAFDAQPCGGTHPKNTSEVGCILVVGAERYKGGSRIRFVCGHRALAAFRERRLVLDRLSASLSAPFPALPEAVERAVAQSADLAKQVKALRENAALAEADRLLAAATEDPFVIATVVDGADAAELRTLASALVTRRRGVALLGGRADKAYLALAQSDGLGQDLGSLLQQGLATVEGKGGGRGNLVQGAGSRLDALATALDALAATVRTALASS